MGRRAVRKIDPTLDLSRHLLELERLPAGWSPHGWFPHPDAPLEVEVGSGKGLFLRRAAQGVPEHNFLGLEIARKYARFAAAQLARRRCTNAAVVQGDALALFREHVPDASLRAVHVYFPDPWWKKRHRKRRVINRPFLLDVQRTLEPEGRLHFWTDVREYFETSLELIRETVALEGPLDVPPEPAEHDLDYRTHFERRMRLSDQPVYRSEFRKPASELA